MAVCDLQLGYQKVNFESPGLNHLGLFFPRCFQSSVHLSADLVLHHCHLRKDCFPRWPPVHSKGPQQKQNWCNKAWAIRCVSQHSPVSNRFFHFGNAFKWPNMIPKPMILEISHPILIQKVAPKKFIQKWRRFARDKFAQETLRPPSIDLAQHGCCHHHGRRPKQLLYLNWGGFIPS